MNKDSKLYKQIFLNTKWYLLLVIPIFLILFILIEKVIPINEEYLISHISLDNKIPFISWFVIFYFLAYIGIIGMGIYLILNDSKSFEKYMYFIIITFSLSFLIYVIFPNGNNLRPDLSASNNIFDKIVYFIYQFDSSKNSIPNMYILGCMAVVISLFSTKIINKNWKKFICLFTILVAILSSLFIKQSSILEVLFSIALGFPIYMLVYGKFKGTSTNLKLNIFTSITKFVLNIMMICCVFFAILCENDEEMSRLLFVALQCFIMLLCILVPAVITKTAKVEIPWIMELVFVIFCVGHFILGEINENYLKYSWWDDMLHTMSGFLLGILGFVLVNTLNNSKYINANAKLNPIFVCVFALGIALIGGVLWEIVEYTIDGITGSNMQRYMDSYTNELLVGRDALKDTMSDFMLDTLGAFIACALGYLELKFENYRITSMQIKNISTNKELKENR